MKGLYRVALALGFVAASAVSVEAAQTYGTTNEIDNTEVRVMNNHMVAVRVYAEDSDGKLYRLGRLARGRLGTFTVPAELARATFRIKVFPSNPLGAPMGDEYGVKTDVLDFKRDYSITLWLEADLSRSMVEIDRG